MKVESDNHDDLACGAKYDGYLLAGTVIGALAGFFVDILTHFIGATIFCAIAGACAGAIYERWRNN